MDLIPILASLSTGVPWLDHTLRVIGLLYIAYSVFLNILVAAHPDAVKWGWVAISLAAVANLNGILSKVIKKEPILPPIPPPPPVPKYIEDTLPTDLPTKKFQVVQPSRGESKP